MSGRRSIKTSKLFYSHEHVCSTTFFLLIHNCLYVWMSVYHPNGDHKSDYPSHGDIGNIIHVVNLSVAVPHSMVKNVCSIQGWELGC